MHHDEGASVRFLGAKQRGLLGLVLAVALFVIIFAVRELIGRPFLSMGLRGLMMLEIVLALIAAVALVVFGATRALIPSRKALRLAWQDCGGFIIVGAVLALLHLVGLRGSELAADWPLRLLEVAILCVAVGVFEEGVFRGLLLGGLLDGLPKTKRCKMLALVICSLLFGVVHIQIFGLAWDDGMQVSQAILKIVQVGIYGFAMGISVLRSQSLFGVVLLHGLDDFCSLAGSMALMGQEGAGNYVNDGGIGVVTIGVYVIFIVIYLPIAVKTTRRYLGELQSGEPAV